MSGGTDCARCRVAVLASGRGSNLTALHRASLAPDYPAEIVGVVSDHADAGALAYAREHALPCAAIERGVGEAKGDHEARIGAALDRWNAEIVCLAGYMRVLSPALVACWAGRMLNIHPSLLPAFPGLDTHARALARGVRVHGCTVHLVTDGVDEGPILDQAWLAVGDEDADALAARVLALEHGLYPRALAAFIRERFTRT